MSTATTTLPLLVEEVEAVEVERLGPHFVRVAFASPALAELGVDGAWRDQRFKLILPDGDRPLPNLDGVDASWFDTWMQRPVEERGHMRTYTVAEVRGTGEQTRLVVDFVLHGHDGHGEAGPGSAWAARARPGDRLIAVAPRRGHEFGGIEFDPGTAARLLLAGDETAVPAIVGILRDLPAGTRGAAFLEVPSRDDVRTIAAPDGVRVTWLARDDQPRGHRLHEAVLAHLGERPRVIEVGDEEVDPDLWETPTWSSSGEAVDDAVRVVGHDLDDVYAWIAGEAKIVTGLRRALVKDLGLDRRQVAFMGYWREGVAMRS